MAQVDPFALGEVSSLGLEGMPVAVAASGAHVFVATAAGQLQVVDLSDRSAPKLLAIQDLASPVTALAAFLDGGGRRTPIFSSGSRSGRTAQRAIGSGRSRSHRAGPDPVHRDGRRGTLHGQG